ncbi:hypothetical protein HZS_454 [Henneguya salminicola]|nr:hypothetical protein HZS_454 [Henneguya salminicola]
MIKPSKNLTLQLNINVIHLEVRHMLKGLWLKRLA